MGRRERTVTASLIVALLMLVTTPKPLHAQARPVASPIASSTLARPTWTASARPVPTSHPDFIYQEPDDRSAARIITTHTLVGTGAGLLLGLVLSGASVGDDHTTVVLTWTSLGAAAGGLSSVITWLLGR